MAAKKIGALITLDGEKEFNQNVTSCNKTLSSLKSEMGLVKAQCEGQQNSLESLTKKHEVLTKILEEQKRKEEEDVKKKKKKKRRRKKRKRKKNRGGGGGHITKKEIQAEL